MGRIVRITVDAGSEFSVTAIRHLLTYKAATSQLMRVLSAGWDAVTSEDSQQLETLLALWTGTATGTSTNVDATKADPGDAAHGGTIYKDTPTADLTIVADSIIHSAAGPINGGWVYRPVPEELILLPAATQVSLKLLEAPGAAFTVRPWLILELFGA